MRLASLRRFPFTLFLLGTAASFLIITYPPLHVSYGLGADSMKKAEFYPLSSFPMYSRFSDRPILVYVADGAGNPLPALGAFGVRTSVLKKYYDTRLRELKEATGVPLGEMTPAQKQPAGDATLRHLVENLAAPGAPVDQALTLHEVALGFGESGTGITRESHQVGAVRP